MGLKTSVIQNISMFTHLRIGNGMDITLEDSLLMLFTQANMCLRYCNEKCRYTTNYMLKISYLKQAYLK